LNKKKYQTVLKSSSIIGGAAMINILIGMVRTKFVAIWLGPSGVGLLNIFNSLKGTLSTFAGMGIATSGVRQIAEANGTKDLTRVAKVVKILRQTVLGTGALGALLMVILSPWLCDWTFGNRDHLVGVALLGFTVLIGNIATGQACLIQGMRKIKNLAQMQILGALSATIISLPLFYFYGIRGILPSLLLTSLAGLITSWWFARKIPLDAVDVSKEEAIQEVKNLLGFGMPIMLAALQVAVVAYLIRIVLIQRFGLEGVGQWAAASALSGILINFVLQAMGADYYPRLTSVKDNHAMMRDEVNAQAHIALLLALPALLATMLFAPLAIKIFYSGSFDEAIPILRWMLFGVFGRVVGWPIGYVILAKGMGKTYFFSQVEAHFGNLLWVLIFTSSSGLTGSGMAFAMTFGVHIFVVIFLGWRTIRFRWSRENFRLIILSLLLLISSFCLDSLPWNEWGKFVLSAGIVVVVGVFCLRSLSQLSGWNLQSVIGKFRSQR
jgi:enterobacterial common antigen flippase